MAKARSSKSSKQTVLGLDIGSNSVGWGLLELNRKGPVRVIDRGARAFDAGVEGMLEQGREKSRHTQRREARHRRRQADRQVRRMRKVAYTLQEAGLLPKGDLREGPARNEFFAALDRAIYDAHENNEHPDGLLSRLPYYLRTRALDHALTAHELGRAFYHLAQRRGFLSNRKSAGDEEETGTVKPAITALVAEMEKIGARTLGEYLAKSDPVNERRIRNRWTSRKMYEHEFERIWAAQQRHHPGILTDELRENLHFAIFFQRPLKSQKGLVGKCDLEDKRPRMALALLPAQRFRLLQKVNDIKICFDDGTDRGMTPEERSGLIDALETEGDLTFKTGVCRAIGLKRKGITFNLEEGGEKKLVGNRTGAKLRDLFGKRWDEFTDQQRSQILSEVLGVHKVETMARRGREVWGLDAEAAEKLASLRLEEGYCAHSKEALKKLLPLMEEGLQYATAKKETYGEEEEKWQKIACDLLPPVNESGIELRNPAVQRALTEVRKVVNHIIKRHGKPDKIRIELARDLKRARGEREKIWKRTRSREKERDAARAALEKHRIQHPSRDDVEKYLLWEECNKRCPYTGKSISFGALFGESSQFDVEHIWPFSRTLDNSFINKTLCYNEENRSRKRNQTPHEVYSEDEGWEAMLERVGQFKGEAKDIKLRRFRSDKIDTLDEFTSRQLNDTRYASKLAAQYLGLLYGDEALSKIEVSTGQITAHLRNAWNLNGILSDGPRKTRDDHRHHAVDAIVIALIDRSRVKAMSKAAEEQFDEKGRERGWWNRVKEPWEGFLGDVEQAIKGIITSHRVNRRVRGRLHEDTNYTAPRVDEDGATYVAVRKPLNKDFGQSMVNSVIDGTLRKILQRHLDDHGGDAKKAFGDPKHHPRLTNGLPVHRARIKVSSMPFSVGTDHARRWVTNRLNHHVEIYSYTNESGRTEWGGEIITMYEAHQRAFGRNRSPVILRDHGSGREFVFSLSLGESIQMLDNEGNNELYLVTSISKTKKGVIEFEFKEINDARLRPPRKGRTRKLGSLMTSKARKVLISPLGEVFPAND